MANQTKVPSKRFDVDANNTVLAASSLEEVVDYHRKTGAQWSVINLVATRVFRI